ncbi:MULTISPECIES: hypothetical protein [unclassified Streptomyces]|uniref:hypothetical protein n=1 Tax=unclassified Streptomyces TaxID=2593676 RepID=UPI003FD07AF8
MSSVLEKVNASEELRSVSMHSAESEWISAMSPVLATPAAFAAGVAGAAASAGAFAAGVAVGQAVFG